MICVGWICSTKFLGYVGIHGASYDEENFSSNNMYKTDRWMFVCRCCALYPKDFGFGKKKLLFVHERETEVCSMLDSEIGTFNFCETGKLAE
jgi:hypothetical protein